jgi:RNA polymerase sigma-70 factor (ECF subfamily)
MAVDAPTAPRPSSGNVTALLRAWKGGDTAAADRLMPFVYDDLRRVARRQLRREGPAATLSPTELVHESYLRLLGQATFENRAHFLALAATLMRRILVDRARRRRAARRGGADHQLVTLDGFASASAPQPIDVIALDRALDDLASFDSTQSRVVELHFFGGLTFEEVASVLGISSTTVYREWRVARLWLLKQLSGEKRGR